MAAKSIETIRAAINRRGQSWEPAPNPVAALNASERKARLGLRVTPAELTATAKAVSAAEALRSLTMRAAPPAAIDWRNNGGDWTTPIKDQMNCGSCVAFATAATIESRVNIACRNASLDPNLSEAHLFFCGCGNCCGTGWNFAPALDFAKNTGVALDSAFPYTPGDQPCKAGLSPYVKVSAWTAVLAIADRKSALAAKGPMVAGLAIFEDFYSYRSGVYRHATGALEGYHAVSVVGYDDAQSCWICKNSWGATWGDSGWFKIGYGDESGIDKDFAFYDVDVPCPDARPDDDCAKYVEYLVSVLREALRNPRLRLCLRYHVCKKGRRPACSALHLRVVKSVSLILEKCPQYRASFCRYVG
jgi:C1A family cysteine protease